MRLMRYDFLFDHVPGKFLYTVDALFRVPIDQDPSVSEELQSEVECYVNAVMVSLLASDHRLEEICIELKRDTLSM